MSKARGLADLGNVYSDGALSNRNMIINGAMQVDQRNGGAAVTGITSGVTFVSDRWRFEVGSCGTWTVQQIASNIAGFGKSIRVTCTTGASLSAGSYVHLYTGLEGQDVQQLMKGTATAKSLNLSFPILCDDTKTFVVEVRDRDNGRHICGTMTVASGGVEQDVSFEFDGDTTGAFDDDVNQSLQLIVWLAAGSTYTSGTLATAWASQVLANRAVGCSNLADATSNYFEVTGVQLELGDTATPFEHRSYGDELARCFRYFQKFDSVGAVYQRYGVGFNYSTTGNSSPITLLTPMRAVPSVGTTGTAANYAINHNADSITACSSLPTLAATADNPKHNIGITCTVGSGLDAGDIGVLLSNNNDVSFLSFDSEL